LSNKKTTINKPNRKWCEWFLFITYSLNPNLMKHPIIIFASLSFFLLSAFTVSNLYKIKTDAAKASFTIKNAGLKVKGSFTDMSGDINFDPNDLASSHIEAVVKASSIDTGIKLRDKDLRGNRFLGVEQYPEMRFQSSSITKSDNAFILTGQLTIKDVSKTISFPFTFENQTFKGSFKLNRRDYHVGGKSWVTSDEVNVSLEVPVE